MKLHRFLFLALAAWAGWMAFRANLVVAPFMTDTMQTTLRAQPGNQGYSSSSSRSRGLDLSLFGGSENRGGIGGIGVDGNTDYSTGRHTPDDDSVRKLRETLNVLKAAAEGDVNKLQKFIDSGVAVNGRDDDHRTALMYAVWNGHDESASILIAAGADSRLEDGKGYTALDYAAGRGLTETVRFLLKRLKQEDNNHFMEQAQLVAASYAGNLALVPAGKLASLNRLSPEDQTPLMIVAGNGSTALASEFLQRGADVNKVNSQKQTALHWAAWNNQLAAITLLLDNGADRDAADATGKTALILAAENNRKDVVALLLQRGADKDAADNKGKTALFIAKDKGYKDIVALLQR